MNDETPDKTRCPNCEKEFDSSFNYCPHCGQKNVDPDLKLKHFLSEYLSANFNIDSKFFVTLKTLIFEPAKLTKELLAGKREKYLTPIRLYLLISLVYFFTFSLGNDNNGGIILISHPGNQVTLADSIDDALITIDNIEDVDIDSLSYSEKILYTNLKLLDTPEGRLKFRQKIKKNLSLGMFILIPLTAFIFYILFRKRTKYYIPNLVFTIHLQSLIFLWFSVFSILELITDSPILKIAETAFIIFLMFKWIKSFYNTSTTVTILNLLLFSIAFLILLVLFFATIIGTSVLFLN